jgi:hypothetical protein
VISLLNHYFVPVYVSNEDYAGNGTAPAEEKAERQRIYREALQAKLSAGTVHVYILDPAGHCIDSQHVAVASKVDKLIDMLERTIARLKTPEGQLLVPARPQSVLRKSQADALLLHLTARNLVRQGDDYVIPAVKLGENRSGSWGAYPGENWFELQRADWSRLLPSAAVKPGASWDIDPAAAAKILNYFYPATENNDIKTNRILQQTLTAKVLSERGGVIQARLDGYLKMKHPFYHREDDQVVETAIVGILEFASSGKGIPSLQLVSDKATYGSRPFGVAVRSVP